MAQDTLNAPLDNRKRGIYTQYDKNLDVATTGSFVTALTVNSEGIRESVFIIHNNDAGDLDYQILATAERPDDIVAPTGTNDDDKGWIVLTTGSIATTEAPEIQTLTNPYTQVIVQVKHSVGTTNVDIWHRGEN